MIAFATWVWDGQALPPEPFDLTASAMHIPTSIQIAAGRGQRANLVHRSTRLEVHIQMDRRRRERRAGLFQDPQPPKPAPSRPA